MQFKVPQDVQRPDTIIGPITLKQLVILGSGGAIAYFIFVSLAQTYFIEIWLPPVLIVSGLTLAFAFLKVNNREFHIFLMNLIAYNLGSKKRIWIQGTGRAFIPPGSTIQKKKTGNAPDAKAEKEGKIADLSTALEQLDQKNLTERAKELHENKK